MAARKDRSVVAADAVGDRMERLTGVVCPLGREYIVHDLARIGREGRRVLRALREPRGGQVAEQRLALCDLDQRGRARERQLARGEQLLSLVRQAQEVEALADQPL